MQQAINSLVPLMSDFVSINKHGLEIGLKLTEQIAKTLEDTQDLTELKKHDFRRVILHKSMAT
jgi:hypothetical protein